MSSESFTVRIDYNHNAQTHCPRCQRLRPPGQGDAIVQRQVEGALHEIFRGCNECLVDLVEWAVRAKGAGMNDMVCSVCKQEIEQDVALLWRGDSVRHLPGSPHCKFCEKCEGPCLKPNDHS